MAQRRREKSHRQEAPDGGVIGEETVGELAERIGVEQRRADRAEFDGSKDTLIDQWLLDYAERETTGIDEPVAKRDRDHHAKAVATVSPVDLRLIGDRWGDRKSKRLNSSHACAPRMP